MDQILRQNVRSFLRHQLLEAGEAVDFSDQESLFLSGRLDSLALTQLVLHLEGTHGIDFGALDFSADLVDTVDAVVKLVQPEASRLT